MKGVDGDFRWYRSGPIIWVRGNRSLLMFTFTTVRVLTSFSCHSLPRLGKRFRHQKKFFLNFLVIFIAWCCKVPSPLMDLLCLDLPCLCGIMKYLLETTSAIITPLPQLEWVGLNAQWVCCWGMKWVHSPPGLCYLQLLSQCVAKHIFSPNIFFLGYLTFLPFFGLFCH